MAFKADGPHLPLQRPGRNMHRCASVQRILFSQENIDPHKMCMKKTPKVSVIVPVYGVEKYIGRCVRSLFEQTLEDIEYIFVDD